MMKIPSLQQLLEAGVHFGHQTRRGNPRMKQYIYGAREGVHIIDLTLSEKYLKEACEFSFNLGKSGGNLLLVGTKKQAQPIIEELAKRAGVPFLINRWIGGFLTNYEEISKNIKKLKELTEKKEKGDLGKYTKKEQLLISRRVAQLQRDLGGVLDLQKTPDAVFIVDAVRELTGIKEAKRLGIPVIAIADSNADPTLIDYPIPGNDDAIKAIRIIAEAVVSAFEDGKKQTADKKEKEEAAAVAKAEAIEDLVVPEEEVAAVEEIIEKKAVAEADRKE